MLLNTLPRTIVQQIASIHRTPESAGFVTYVESATILQCDLEGFTRLCATQSPQQARCFHSRAGYGLGGGAAVCGVCDVR